jgi:hypothetical protein
MLLGIMRLIQTLAFMVRRVDIQLATFRVEALLPHATVMLEVEVSVK